MATILRAPDRLTAAARRATTTVFLAGPFEDTDGTEDPWPIEGFRIVQREGAGWTELSPVTNFEGKSNSYAG
mgnify:CR=1 FL=1